MNQQWTISAGLFQPEHIVMCNRLNLYFAQEPINRQIYAFKNFDSENDLNAFVRRIIDQVHNADQDKAKQLFDEFFRTKKLNLWTLHFNAEPKF